VPAALPLWRRPSRSIASRPFPSLPMSASDTVDDKSINVKLMISRSTFHFPKLNLRAFCSISILKHFSASPHKHTNYVVSAKTLPLNSLEASQIGGATNSKPFECLFPENAHPNMQHSAFPSCSVSTTSSVYTLPKSVVGSMLDDRTLRLRTLQR